MRRSGSCNHKLSTSSSLENCQPYNIVGLAFDDVDPTNPIKVALTELALFCLAFVSIAFITEGPNPKNKSIKRLDLSDLTIVSLEARST